MIYMIGGSGGPNYGDELILSYWIKFYRRSGYRGPIVVDCLSKANSEKLHGNISENVFFIPNAKKLARGREGDINYYMGKGSEFVEREFCKKPLGELRQTVPFKDDDSFYKEIKLIHLYGGGYINGVWENSFSLISVAAGLKRKSGAHLFATGLGVAPLKRMSAKDADVLGKALDEFDGFELRDIESYNQMAAVLGFRKNVFLGLDDSYLFLAKDCVERRKHPSIHISGFGKAFSGISDIGMQEIFNKWLGDYKNIYFWMCNSSDMAAAKKMEKISNRVKRLTNNRLINIGIPFNEKDFMITARFHPHLIGARLGMEGCYIAGSSFYKAKHASIIDLGSPYIPFDELSEAQEKRGNNIVSREWELVKRKNIYANHIVDQIKC